MASLSVSDWKKELKVKENSSVKDTGISSLLEDFAKAQKKDDKPAQITALEKILAKTDEISRKYSKLASLKKYLGDMAKDAKVELDKVAKGIEDQDNNDDSDSALADQLKKQKNATSDSPIHFVVTPGKLSTGLVIRKSIGPKHVKEAIAMRGTGTVHFKGECYFEDGKYTYRFPEAPIRGMAKAIKKAAKAFAELAIKVKVTGAGVEFDDEADAEFDAGEAGSGAKSYPKPDAWADVLQKVGAAPIERREASVEGLLGRLGQLLTQAENDPNLSDAERAAMLDQLRKVQADAKKLDPSTQKTPVASKFLSAADWDGLIDRCLRLDATKQVSAVGMLRAKLAEVRKAITADQDLSAEGRQAEQKILSDAEAKIGEKFRSFLGAQRNAATLGQTERMKALELQYDMVQKQSLLPQDIQTDVTAKIDVARRMLATGDAGKSDSALDDLEASLKAALSTANMANSDSDKMQKQKRIFDSAGKGAVLFKKAAFAPGTADALFRESPQLRVDAGIQQIADKFKQCEKDSSDQNRADLLKTANTYIGKLNQFSAALNDPEGADKGKKEAAERQKNAALIAVQRVRLLELATKIEANGPPPWDDAKAETMAELQVAFFFEEGAIMKSQANQQGAADFGADMKGKDTANPAWWINRVDAGVKTEDGKTSVEATKTYIFKPQDLEGTSFLGIPQNGGAAREALASGMSDLMVASGFDIGVCPTHFVDVDATKLKGFPGDGAQPQIHGSMQELAANDGEIAKFIKKDSDGFIKTIDRKKLSDIQVFDLAFGSLDRHGGNLLIKTNPDGTNDLVPIDHGIGLMDPDGLRLYRDRAIGPQNTLMDESLRPDDPINEETRANLMKLDARVLADEMKAKQARLAQRHPDTKDKVQPDAFDQVASRIEFMQAAADKMSYREMTSAIMQHAKQIGKTPKADMPKLVDKLKAEAVEAAKANAELNGLIAVGSKNLLPPLADLGWAQGMAADAFKLWVNENAQFALKIIKTKTQNPALTKQIAALIQKLGGDTAIEYLKLDLIESPIEQIQVLETELKKKFPSAEQIEKERKEKEKAEAKAKFDADTTLHDRLSKSPEAKDTLEKASKYFEIKNIPDLTPKQIATNLERWREIEALGGANALEEVRNLFESPAKSMTDAVTELGDYDSFKKSNGLSDLKSASAVFPGALRANVSQARKLVGDWQEFEKLGGLQKYIELGGTMKGESGADDCLASLRDLLDIKESGQLEAMADFSDEQVAEMQLASIAATKKNMASLLRTITHKAKLTEFADKARALVAAEKSTDLNNVQRNYTKLIVEIKKRARLEQTRGIIGAEYNQLKADVTSAKQRSPTFDWTAFEKLESEYIGFLEGDTLAANISLRKKLDQMKTILASVT